MTFDDISKFLGETPISRKRATCWNSFNLIYDLLWSPSFDHKRKWKQKYLQGFHKILEMLIEVPDSSGDLKNEFLEKVRTLFEYYCPCIPATSMNRWLAPDGSKNRLAWLSFDKSGNQEWNALLYPYNVDRGKCAIPISGSSWTFVHRPIHWDAVYKTSAELIGTMGDLRDALIEKKGVLNFRSYDNQYKQMIFYENESHQNRSNWFRERQKKMEWREYVSNPKYTG